MVETTFDVIEQLNRGEKLTIVPVEQNAHQALDIAHIVSILQSGSIVLRGETTALADKRAVQELYMGGQVRGPASAGLRPLLASRVRAAGAL